MGSYLGAGIPSFSAILTPMLHARQYFPLDSTVAFELIGDNDSWEAFWRSLQPQLGAMMMLPTEPIGSIPRPAALIAGIQGFEAGRISQLELNVLYHAAVQDTIQRFKATGSPVITDGEQAKYSWATYSIYGLKNFAPDGVPICSRIDTFETF